MTKCICGEEHERHPVPLLSMGLSTTDEVVSVEPFTAEDGRRAWRCVMADGVREIVVELREAPAKGDA
jgi:hypothetical protein